MTSNEPILQEAVNPNEFEVWKTLKLGTGIKDANAFRRAIKGKNMRIGDWANDILGKPAFSVATEETEVDLILISVAELGFEDGVKLKDIYARAQELGLQLCPSEVGSQLRLEYPNQPKGEWLIIGMEPITDSDGSLRLFHVEQGSGGLWLNGFCDCPGYFWDGFDRFVFVLPRK